MSLHSMRITDIKSCLHMQSLGVSVASLSSWAASTLFTRSLGESEEQERDGFMTVDQEWKWDQACGIPACYRRIDEVPLSFRAKRDSWKHSIHSRFILLRISSPLSPFYVQLPCQLPQYYPMECSTSWFDFIASWLRMSQIWVPIPSRHSNSHYKKTVVSSTIPAHTEHNGHMHQWDMDV